MTTWTVRFAVVFGAVVAVGGASADRARTAFTCQGQLKRGGAPVNCTPDFESAPFDRESAEFKRALHDLQRQVAALAARMERGTEQWKGGTDQ